MKTLKVALLFVVFAFCSCRNVVVRNEVHIGRMKAPTSLLPYCENDSINQLYYRWILQPLMGDSVIGKGKVFRVLADSITVRRKSDSEFVTGVYFSQYARWDDTSEIETNDLLFSMMLSVNPFLNPHHKTSNAVLTIRHWERTDKKGTMIISDDSLPVDELCSMLILPSENYDPGDISNLSLMNRLFSKSLSSDDSVQLKAFAMQFQSAAKPDNTSMLSGSGPYSVLSFNSTQLVLQRKDAWWGNHHNARSPYFGIHPEKLIYHFYPNSQSAIEDLKNNKLDVLDDIPGDEYQKLILDKIFSDGFYFYPTPGRSTYFAVSKKFTNADPVSVAPGYWEGGFQLTLQKK